MGRTCVRTSAARSALRVTAGPRTWLAAARARRIGRVLSLGVIVAVVSCASSSAAVSPVQRRAYAILLHANRGVLAVSSTEVRRGAKLARARLAPCRTALTQPNPNGLAARALGGELREQYSATALRPVLRIAATEATQASSLPLRPSFVAGLRTQVRLIARVQTLNICADLAAWQAAGFAPDREPSGTRLAATFADARFPSLGTVLFLGLTTTQERSITPLLHQAERRVKKLNAEIVSSFNAWARQALGA